MSEDEAAPRQLPPDDIERLAGAAGLTLTPQWRDDLIVGSTFALWAKERLRRLEADTVNSSAEAPTCQRQ